MLLARTSMMAAAASSCGHHRRHASLQDAGLSPAIAATLSPRNAWWSSETGDRGDRRAADHVGGVEPTAKPGSNSTISAAARAKARKAAPL